MSNCFLRYRDVVLVTFKSKLGYTHRRFIKYKTLERHGWNVY